MQEKAGSIVATAPDGRIHAPNGYGRARVILDEVNVGLLRALLDDPRIPIAELARRVQLSGPAVADRLQRLEAAGVIAGYRVELSPAALGRPCAFGQGRARWVRLSSWPSELRKWWSVIA